MSIRKIIDPKHNGEKVWLKGHAKATFMSDGSTVEDAINNIKAEDGGITTETDPIFSASPAAKITEEDIEKWKNNGLKTYVFDAGVFDNENSVSIDKTLTQDELNEIVNADFVYVKYKAYEESDYTFALIPSKTIEEYGFYFGGKVFTENGNAMIDCTVWSDELRMSLAMYSSREIPEYRHSIYDLYLDVDINDGMTVDLSEVKLYEEAYESTTYGMSVTLPDYSRYILQKVMADEFSNDILMGQYNDNSILKLTYNKLKPNNSVINIISRGTYSKPSTGIPKSDLASAVQTSLGKADTALQSHQDISGKQDKLVSGTTIKTINGESILGEGNITVNSGANIQADWNETNTESDAYIKNKPDISSDGMSTNIGENGQTPVLYSPIIYTYNDDCYWEFGSKEFRCENYSSNPFVITANGDGTKFLANDGRYKTIEVSGGSSSESSAYPLVEHGTSDTTFILTSNTFHVWDEVDSLDLSFAGETAGVANEYLFQFTSGATATTLTLPDSIKWANDSVPTIAENKIYQISILKGLGSILEFGNGSSLFPVTIVVGTTNQTNLDVYNYLYTTYGEVTTTITEELSFDVDGHAIDVTFIEYASHEGLTGFWLNGYVSMNLKYVLTNSGSLTRILPSSTDPA